MARLKLSKRTIDGLTTTNKYGVKFYDIELPAFGIKIFPSGRKTFFVTYTHDGKRQQIFIGAYGVLTVDEARKKAKKELSKVLDGVNPQEERCRRTDIKTFSEWVAQYLVDVVDNKKHPREDRRYLAEAVKVFGNKCLNELRVDDIQRIFNRKRPHPVAANRWLASVRSCLQCAWRQELISTNPAMKVKILPEPEPRRRVLTDQEYIRLISAIDQLPDRYCQIAFHLLLETGARLSEVLHAKWEHFDLVNGLWRIPSTKSGKPQTIPLIPEVKKLLDNIPRTSVYIIAGKTVDKPRSDLKRPWALLVQIADLQDIHIHDLRRTFGLQMTLSAGLHMASRLLRHTDIRVTERHYAPLDVKSMEQALESRKHKLNLLEDNSEK